MPCLPPNDIVTLLPGLLLEFAGEGEQSWGRGGLSLRCGVMDAPSLVSGPPMAAAAAAATTASMPERGTALPSHPWVVGLSSANKRKGLLNRWEGTKNETCTLDGWHKHFYMKLPVSNKKFEILPMPVAKFYYVDFLHKSYVVNPLWISEYRLNTTSDIRFKWNNTFLNGFNVVSEKYHNTSLIMED